MGHVFNKLKSECHHDTENGLTNYERDNLYVHICFSLYRSLVVIILNDIATKAIHQSEYLKRVVDSFNIYKSCYYFGDYRIENVI